ncbi:MAG TPA: 50S ribosomal protein L13 [Dehalococcoidia bacterium]|nr:50S ribosomal protein L13 [Dehalococcoidia bacterium]
MPLKRPKTYQPKERELVAEWHVLDADGQVLGRLASQAAHLLMGKHKPNYTPHLPVGDYVVIVNAAKVRVTGKKLTDKVYYRHTGYMGGIRAVTLRDLLAKHPERVIQLTVRRMLPKNRLGRYLLGRLKVYAGPDHPHEAQVRASEKRRAALASEAATKE